MSGQSPARPPPERPSAPPHEIGLGLAPVRENTAPGTPSEMMLGLWTSWVESASKLASDLGAAPGSVLGQALWQMSPDQLTSGLKQLGDMAAKDSILASILRATDDVLSANPLPNCTPPSGTLTPTKSAMRQTSPTKPGAWFRKTPRRTGLAA